MANGSYPQMPPTASNPQQPMQQMPQQQQGYPPYRGQQWGATPAAYQQPQGKEGIRLGVPAVIGICVLAAAVVLLCMSFAFGVWDRQSGTPSAPVAPSGTSSPASGGTGAGSRTGTGSGTSSVSSYVMTENLTDTMRKTLAGIQDCKWEIEDQSGNWYAFAEDGTFTGHVGTNDMSGRYMIWFGEDALRHMSQGMVDDMRERYKARPQFIDGHVFHISITVLQGSQPALDELDGLYEPMSAENYALNTLWLMDRDNIGTYTSVENLPGEIHFDENGNMVVEEA